MINIAFVRGQYLNNFEGQNYCFSEKIISLVGFSSIKTLHHDFPFSVIHLPSISDFLGNARAVKVIANRTLGDAQMLFGISKFASQFDIFHTADPHYYYSYQLAKLRSQNKIKKLLVTSWETIPHNNETVMRKKEIKQFVLKHADHFLCYTKKAKECLISEGIGERNIEIIRLGVDLERFNIQNSRTKGKNINILFVGRLVEEKGVMDLYDAFKEVKSQKLNITLKIVGEGALRNKLQKMIDRDNLKKFVNIDKSAYEDMPGIYKQADIFVLPSKKTKTWEEQYGMVLIEAMASGLPIVTCDTGAIREVVGKAGILIKEGDIHGLGGVIKTLIESSSLRQKIGTMGRKRAEEEFDSKKTAKKIEQLYKKLYITAK